MDFFIEKESCVGERRGRFSNTVERNLLEADDCLAEKADGCVSTAVKKAQPKSL